MTRGRPPLPDHERQRRRAEQKQRWVALNRDKKNEANRRYRLAHADRRGAERAQRHRRKAYGLSQAAYQALLAYQFHCCAICRTMESGGPGGFNVDHWHGCCGPLRGCAKCVRGLLCFECNVGFGYLDWPAWRKAAAENYLVDPPWHRVRDMLALPEQQRLPGLAP